MPFLITLVLAVAVGVGARVFDARSRRPTPYPDLTLGAKAHWLGHSGSVRRVY